MKQDLPVHFVTGVQKRDRAQAVLLAAADRRIEEVARGLVKLTEGFREIDFHQLEDSIPPEVWDGLVQAMVEYRRKELVGR